MKKTSVFIRFLLVACIVLQSLPLMVTSAENIAVEKIVVKVEEQLDEEPIEIEFSGKAGTYAIIAEYKAIDEKISAIDIKLSVNGKQADISLPKYWTTNELYREDGNKNQFAPEQILVTDYNTHTLTHISNYALCEYNVDLNDGVNKLVITPVNGKAEIKSITFTAPENPEAYNTPTSDLYNGEEFSVEGEAADLKNNYWLNSGADMSSPHVSPYSATKSMINYIGGANWKDAGDTIYWTVNAPESAYYKIDFAYRQTTVVNGSTYRSLRVNGELPFAEAASIAFPYSTSWKTIGVESEEGEDYLIWLNEGENVLSLTATIGGYSEVCTLLDSVVEDLQNLYLEINQITGETVDIYRDYQLFNQIPDFNKRLSEASKQLDEIDKMISSMADGSASSYSGSVRNMKQTVDLMINNKYTAHRYKNTYYSNFSALIACLNDMQDTPLDIDKIVFSAPGQEQESGFFDSLASFGKTVKFEIERFVASFAEDYNNISGSNDSDEEITIWVNWGRDQAQVLNNLIQSSFTSKYDIAVNVKISNATVVQGNLSGNGPDVILQQARTEPVNLAIRGLLYDLTQFSDYEQVLEQFVEGAEVPYMYNDGLYALPDTQTFMALFYRTDIFEKYNLSVPETWDEFRTASKVLLRNNYSVWVPYTQITDMTLVNTGIGSLNIFPTLMLQNGRDIYTENGKATTLTTAESIEVFNDWTSYYTKMKLPYQMDFYNRFRAGTTPMGVSIYTVYNTIKNTASEINGKWQIAPLPGVMGEDGTINNVSAGGGTGCAILNDCENKEAAWEFLKWWTSAETQLAYSNSLEAILGIVGRVAVSNTEAFENMTWDVEMFDTLKQIRQNTVELREVPGSYYVSRSIDFAFWNVVDSNENPKDMLVTWGQESDKEIERKWAQYENK